MSSLAVKIREKLWVETFKYREGSFFVDFYLQTMKGGDANV